MSHHDHRLPARVHFWLDFAPETFGCFGHSCFCLIFFVACGPTGLTIHHRHAWNLFLKSRFFTKQSKPQTKWILDAHHSKPPNSISFCHRPSPISDRKGGTFEASWLVQAWNKSSCLDCPFSSGADLLMQTFPFRTSSQCNLRKLLNKAAGIWGGCVPLKFPWRYFTQFQAANTKHGTQGNTRPLGLVVFPWEVLVGKCSAFSRRICLPLHLRCFLEFGGFTKWYTLQD